MLLSCDRGSFLGLHSCTHSQDAGVRCPGQYEDKTFHLFMLTMCIRELIDYANTKRMLYVCVYIYIRICVLANEDPSSKYSVH